MNHPCSRTSCRELYSITVTKPDAGLKCLLADRDCRGLYRTSAENASEKQTNSLLINNAQSAVGGCATEAHQFQMGVFNQTANADGLCAVIGLLQETKTDAPATQVPLITNGVGPVGQQENLTLQVGQAAAKTGGGGSGIATQSAALMEGQSGSNAATALHQSSAVASNQLTAVSGSPTAEGLALATMQATTSQIQLVN